MNLNRTRIMDGGRWRPTTRLVRVEVTGPDGKVRTEERIERLAGQRNIMALHPAGHVIQLVLGNANAMAEEGKTPYYDQILQAKKAKGFLPWGRCPVAMLAAQEITHRALKNAELHHAQPCTGGGFGPANPCPHALAEKQFRTDVHNAKEKARAEAYKAEAERDRDQRDRHHQELMDAMVASRQPAPAQVPPGVPSRGKRGDAEG